MRVWAKLEDAGKHTQCFLLETSLIAVWDCWLGFDAFDMMRFTSVLLFLEIIECSKTQLCLATSAYTSDA